MARIQIELPEKFSFHTEIQIYFTHINVAGHLDNSALIGLLFHSHSLVAHGNDGSVPDNMRYTLFAMELQKDRSIVGIVAGSIYTAYCPVLKSNVSFSNIIYIYLLMGPCIVAGFEVCFFECLST